MVVGYRASLAAAESRAKALDDLRLPARLLNKDLPVRRMQAHIGVEVARHALDRVESDTRYAVTRMYFTAQYVRAQQRLVDEWVARLKQQYEQVVPKPGEKPKEDDKPKWTKVAADLLVLYLSRAKARQAEVEAGLGLALAALREVMGLAPEDCFALREEPLPDPAVVVCREEIVSLAVTRRGEYLQATEAAEVVGLEVSAQAKTLLPATVRTFASRADIHAELALRGLQHFNYRPSLLVPEMPVMLSGSRADRLETAQQLVGRAQAVADKTRGLVALDAENAYWKWYEASKQAEAYREAVRAGKELMKTDRNIVEQIVENFLIKGLLEIQAQSALNEALFNKLEALADLERVTAGGFRAHLAGCLP
jgi:hypothetical protein